MEVTPGKWYAVTTDNSCTVTDANGKVLCTAEAGEQKYFLATTPSITLSDEGATVTKATFNCALAALGLLGGGTDKLPAGYMRAEFLESSGDPTTQFIVTEVCIGDESEVVFSAPYYNDTNRIFGAVLYGETYSYLLGITSSGSVFVRLRNYEQSFVYEKAAGHDKKHVVYLGENEVTLNGNVISAANYKMPEYPSGVRVTLFREVSWRANGEIDSFSAGKRPSRIYGYKGWRGGIRKGDYIPALDETGAPCMFDLVTRKPFYNDGTGQFIVGMKDAAQLRTVLRKLPDLTGQDMGTLTLSIPAESNTPEMQELLDTTETQKNWELTIQERAAEVATYMLRRMRKVVWVRKVQAENGSYVDASGLRWQTEWCSAIYSPRGNDPTLHGYEPFDSVAQAVETWGLAPYEYPEEELLTETE